MTLFRPCIDLHAGVVKQIVGGSFRDDAAPTTNFTASHGADYYAAMYRSDGLWGGHVIQLGPGNDDAARAALSAFPGGLQLGGGVTAESAQRWLDAGASKVIVTSDLFEHGRLSAARLEAWRRAVTPDQLVIDLSCRRVGTEYRVAIQRWQTLTDVVIVEETLRDLATFCSEFLVHAADVEGLRGGIDETLVERLGAISPRPCTYAGGANDMGDLARVDRLSAGRVDLTFGSALDIFGGKEVRYADCVAWNKSHAAQELLRT
jgi:phosphoribosylformimino-5-aminoimidazole carboxamide ribotide isomerase